MSSYLNKPYPINLNRWKISITISIFVSLFLLMFQPFGLINLKLEHKSIIIAGYGVVTFIVLLFNLFILPLFLKKTFIEEKWTILKQIIWLNWIVLTIGTFNYLYSVLFNVTQWFGFNGLCVFVIFTFLVAIIPIVIVTILTHNRLLKQNLSASAEMNSKLNLKQNTQLDIEEITIHSENKKKQFAISSSNLICIESDGNYINIFYFENEKIIKKTIRNTLKNIESQIAHLNDFNKCHRAFIVNILFIDKVKGNSQGYHLKMKHLNFDIPVSRNNSKKFKEFIDK